MHYYISVVSHYSTVIFHLQFQVNYGHEHYINTNAQVPRSVGSKEKVEKNIDKQTDATSCFTGLVNMVVNYTLTISLQQLNGNNGHYWHLGLAIATTTSMPCPSHYF